VNVDRQGETTIPLTINEPVAKAYFQLLDRLRTLTSLTAEIQGRDLTQFGEIFQAEDAGDKSSSEEWKLTEEAIMAAIQSLNVMRGQEGSELERDLRERIDVISRTITTIEALSKDNAKLEFTKLKERVKELTTDVAVLNSERLELEIALVAERLDITEELVRFRSHLKFFLEATSAKESAGRKLNFILQEMNREANTIGSKTNVADVAHHVVQIKQELEKIREQVQNIE
jgi:uncharacterized protein (TIGR00255 family)